MSPPQSEEDKYDYEGNEEVKEIINSISNMMMMMMLFTFYLSIKWKSIWFQKLNYFVLMKSVYS